MDPIGLDLSTSSFSATGRIMQIDYAIKAVEKSTTIIGIRGSDAVVLAYKKVAGDPLYTQDNGDRIFCIEKNIGIALSGLIADGNLILTMARQEAQFYRNDNKAMIPLGTLCERIASYVHVHTMHCTVRPFGLSILLAGWDEDEGPQLFKIDPCGTFYGYYGWACGMTGKEAKKDLEKYPVGTMSTEELVKAAGEILYNIQEDNDQREFSLVLSLVGEESAGVHIINPDPWIAMAVNAGKSAIGESECDAPVNSKNISQAK